MTRRLGRRLRRSLLVLAALAGLGCESEPAACGNEVAIWLHRVRVDCSDCRQLEFVTEIAAPAAFPIRAEPDFVLERCDVARGLVHEGALTLLLTPAAQARLARARDAWVAADREQLVALRLAGADRLFAVKFAADLGMFLTLFDLGNAGAVRAFLHDLGLSAIETGVPMTPSADLAEGGAAGRARAILEDEASLEALQGALDREAARDE